MRRLQFDSKRLKKLDETKSKITLYKKQINFWSEIYKKDKTQYYNSLYAANFTWLTNWLINQSFN